MTAATSPPLVVIGQCGGPYGVRGWLHLHSFTDPAENLLDYQPWWRQPSGSDVWLPVDVAKVRRHRSAFVVQFQGVEDRDQAQQLARQLIATSADQLPAAAADEAYWRDLVDCQVFNQQGESLGVVSHLLETGAHDVLVVRDTHGQERLIPYANPYICSTDTAARRIVVDWSLLW